LLPRDSKHAMKWAVIVGDGMADYPCPELGGRTPLEEANHPNMDEIASRGWAGLLRTIPEGMYPGTDIAHLSILGYDPAKYYPGRAVFEAVDLGVELREGDLALRCNLVHVEGGVLVDYSAGHIGDEEARALVEDLARALEGIELYHGSGYRAIAVVRGVGRASIRCHEPHDNMGRSVDDLMIEGLDDGSKRLAERLNRAMLLSAEVLRSHPVNAARVARGLRPANMIMFWGPGVLRHLPSFREVHGLSGSVVSEVPLVRGIGRLLGMRVVNPPGSTGYYDTDYDSIARCALRELERCEVVLVHIEAPDEAGHEGNPEEKVRAIEMIDERVVGRILDERGDDVRVAVLTDHYTPVSVRKHVGKPVPFAAEIPGEGAPSFTESAVAGREVLEATSLIGLLTSASRRAWTPPSPSSPPSR